MILNNINIFSEKIELHFDGNYLTVVDDCGGLIVQPLKEMSVISANTIISVRSGILQRLNTFCQSAFDNTTQYKIIDFRNRPQSLYVPLLKKSRRREYRVKKAISEIYENLLTFVNNDRLDLPNIYKKVILWAGITNISIAYMKWLNKVNASLGNSNRRTLNLLQCIPDESVWGWGNQYEIKEIYKNGNIKSFVCT